MENIAMADFGRAGNRTGWGPASHAKPAFRHSLFDGDISRRRTGSGAILPRWEHRGVYRVVGGRAAGNGQVSRGEFRVAGFGTGLRNHRQRIATDELAVLRNCERIFLLECGGTLATVDLAGGFSRGIAHTIW